MTPNESKILEYMNAKGVVSWSELRDQFCKDEGGMTVLLNSLKRNLLIQQDRLFYRLTEAGKDALIPSPRRKPFEGVAVW